MIQLFILLTLSCPVTKMQNITPFPWNDHDFNTLAFVKNRCVQIYPDSPCVKLFRKFGKQDYSVICGERS